MSVFHTDTIYKHGDEACVLSTSCPFWKHDMSPVAAQTEFQTHIIVVSLLKHDTLIYTPLFDCAGQN